MVTTQLDPVEIASYITAGTLAASKLISACKPLWNRLPRWLAISMPVLVLDLPQVSQYFAGVSSGHALFAAFITSLALVLPGLSEAEHPTDPKPPTNSPIS